jgi:hypothetical protein
MSKRLTRLSARALGAVVVLALGDGPNLVAHEHEAMEDESGLCATCGCSDIWWDLGRFHGAPGAPNCEAPELLPHYCMVIDAPHHCTNQGDNH